MNGTSATWAVDTHCPVSGSKTALGPAAEILVVGVDAGVDLGASEGQKSR